MTTSGLAAGFGVSTGLAASVGFGGSAGLGGSVGCGGAWLAVGAAPGPQAARTAPVLLSSDARSAALRPYCFIGGGWNTLNGGTLGSFSPPQQSQSTTIVW